MVLVAKPLVLFQRSRVTVDIRDNKNDDDFNNCFGEHTAVTAAVE